MEDFIQSIIARARQLKEQKTASPTKAEDIRADFDLELGEDQLDPDTSLPDILEGIFKYSVNTQNPRFLNQLYGGTHEVTWLGDLLTSILNTSMATYEIAPLATLMEKELIQTINREIKFPQIEGIMVPGGSNANMMGLHCARFSRNPIVKEEGLYDLEKYHIYYSGEAHYSTRKAMTQLGLGTNQLIKVEADDSHRMSVEMLEAAIQQSLRDDAIPLCVVSTTGTTVWGSFDPINEIQDICDRYQVWHHVDAAWGGLALWSERKNDLFQGVERVDSITMDFHKLMGASLTKAFFLTSHPDVLYSANSGGGEEYIFHSEDDNPNLDTGKYSLQCGRRVDSLSIWLQWKLQGTASFRQKIGQLYELQEWCVTYLQKRPDQYRLLQVPDFMNICFQIIPKDPKTDIGAFNLALRETLMAQGDFMINYSSTPETGAFFRLVLNQWGLTKEILQEVFECLEELAVERSQ